MVSHRQLQMNSSQISQLCKRLPSMWISSDDNKQQKVIDFIDLLCTLKESKQLLHTVQMA
jgi:hypothetical protein